MCIRYFKSGRSVSDFNMPVCYEDHVHILLLFPETFTVHNTSEWKYTTKFRWSLRHTSWDKNKLGMGNALVYWPDNNNSK